MKKLIMLTIALLLLCLPALAETQIFCAGDAGTPAYEISQRLAGDLAGTVVASSSALDAMNLFLAADQDSAVFIGDSSAMILSLQGYTDADLRTAISPAARIAVSPAMMYAAPAVLELCADVTAEGLQVYTENAPFELFIARLIDASPVDYLTLEASAMLYVDQSLYMDWAEMAQAIQDGAVDLCVFGAEMPAELNGLLTPLYDTGMEGPFLGAFVHAGAANAAAVEAAVLALSEQTEVQTLLQSAGYMPGTQKNAAAFEEEVKALFQSYIQYLTNEGLFFYEF
ncbi:MAG: hypothetical protein IJA83_02110 [Clostridia bacterium]|nr:hypothetical protein [Clostridia bacterium]